MRNLVAIGVWLLTTGCNRPPDPASAGGSTSVAPAPPLRDARANCLHALETGRFAGVGRAFCAEVEQHGIPGAAIGVAVDGKVTFAHATGVACAGEDAPVTPDTSFRIGSVTKVMTATIAVQLASQGTVDLDAPITHLLPELQPDRAPTLRTLLEHRSGLRDRPPRPGDSSLELADLGPFEWGPAGKFEYANLGYAIAGAALARASEGSYAKLLRERVAGPLGLATVVLADGAEVPGAACGHTLDGKPMTVAKDFAEFAHGARWTAPSGAVVASAIDLVMFALAFGEGQPLSDVNLSAGAVPTHGDAYGLGARARVLRDGTTLFHHSGDTGSFSAQLYWIPSRGFAVAVLANHPAPLRATLQAALALIDPGLVP